MKRSGLRPWLRVVAGGELLVSSAGAVLLVQTAQVTGLDRLLCQRLVPWRLPLAVHDPGKIVLDLAIAVALGGDCAADLAVVRAQPGVFGLVASDATVWLQICALAQDLIAWMQRLALSGWARQAEPKRLRLRLFSIAGRLVRTARRHYLKIPETWPWADTVITAHHRLTALTAT